MPFFNPHYLCAVGKVLLPTSKFVGTVSLGLLTGLSYTLHTLTIPTLMHLPSASLAAQAFNTLRETASAQIRRLSAVSSGTFVLAFFLSRRGARHPYLLYTALAVLGSSAADFLPIAATGNAPITVRQSSSKRSNRERSSARMEASYEVLGDAHSDGTGSASGEELEEEVNGEEVRAAMEAFLTTNLVRTAIAGLGLAMSVVGIWGDGA